MSDIFNRQTDSYGGSFSSDGAKLTFPALAGGGAEAGLMVMQLSCSYTQQLTRLFELTSPNVYYVAGRTSGQANTARVLGPRKLAANFYKTYGDVCNAKTNTLQVSLVTGCGSGEVGRASFICKFVVIVQVGITMTSADMMVNESMGMIFSSFLYQ